jgi:nucleoid DNA-binding protein
VNAIEIVSIIRKEKPELLGSLPDKKVASIIRESFNQLAFQVESVDEGVVRVAGFGRFKVNQVEREIDGVMEKVKRILFIQHKQSQPGESDIETVDNSA